MRGVVSFYGAGPWFGLRADLHGVGAARVESASRGEIGGSGDLSVDGFESLGLLIRVRERVEQSLGIGMRAFYEDLVDRAAFDDFSGVHDGDFVGHLGDDTEVVCNEDDGHAAVFLEFAEEVEDLGLDGDVKCGGGFVGNEDFGVAREGHGDHDALSHAAGHLVGIVVDAGFGGRDADLLEEIDGGAVRVGFAEPLVQAEYGADLVADAEDGVEGGHGLLENHGNVVTADFAHFGLRERDQILTVEEYFSVDDFSRWIGNESEDGEGGHAFSAAGFAYEGEGLACGNVE